MSNLSHAERCEAETKAPKGHEAEGWQCLRRKADGTPYCRQHQQGTPHGNREALLQKEG